MNGIGGLNHAARRHILKRVCPSDQRYFNDNLCDVVSAPENLGGAFIHFKDDSESGNRIDAGLPAASLSRDQGPAPIDAYPAQ